MSEYSFTPMGRPDPPRVEDKREAILQAALELFAEQGFYGTAVPQIAERARVAAGTIYRHFDSKEALVNALYARYKAQLGACLMSDFPFSLSPRQQFHHFFKRALEFARKEPLAFKFLEGHHHGAYLDAACKGLSEGVLGPACAFFEQGARLKIIKLMPPEALTALSWGAIVGLVRASDEGKVTLDEKLEAAAEDALWDAIRRREP